MRSANSCIEGDNNAKKLCNESTLRQLNQSDQESSSSFQAIFDNLGTLSREELHRIIELLTKRIKVLQERLNENTFRLDFKLGPCHRLVDSLLTKINPSLLEEFERKLSIVNDSLNTEKHDYLIPIDCIHTASQVELREIFTLLTERIKVLEERLKESNGRVNEKLQEFDGIIGKLQSKINMNISSLGLNELAGQQLPNFSLQQQQHQLIELNNDGEHNNQSGSTLTKLSTNVFGNIASTVNPETCGTLGQSASFQVRRESQTIIGLSDGQVLAQITRPEASMVTQSVAVVSNRVTIQPNPQVVTGNNETSNPIFNNCQVIQVPTTPNINQTNNFQPTQFITNTNEAANSIIFRRLSSSSNQFQVQPFVQCISSTNGAPNPSNFGSPNSQSSINNSFVQGISNTNFQNQQSYVVNQIVANPILTSYPSNFGNAPISTTPSTNELVNLTPSSNLSQFQQTLVATNPSLSSNSNQFQHSQALIPAASNAVLNLMPSSNNNQFNQHISCTNGAANLSNFGFTQISTTPSTNETANLRFSSNSNQFPQTLVVANPVFSSNSNQFQHSQVMTSAGSNAALNLMPSSNHQLIQYISTPNGQNQQSYVAMNGNNEVVNQRVSTPILNSNPSNFGNIQVSTPSTNETANLTPSSNSNQFQQTMVVANQTFSGNPNQFQNSQVMTPTGSNAALNLMPSSNHQLIQCISTPNGQNQQSYVAMNGNNEVVNQRVATQILNSSPSNFGNIQISTPSTNETANLTPSSNSNQFQQTMVVANPALSSNPNQFQHSQVMNPSGSNTALNLMPSNNHQLIQCISTPNGQNQQSYVAMNGNNEVVNQRVVTPIPLSNFSNISNFGNIQISTPSTKETANLTPSSNSNQFQQTMVVSNPALSSNPNQFQHSQVMNPPGSNTALNLMPSSNNQLIQCTSTPNSQNQQSYAAMNSNDNVVNQIKSNPPKILGKLVQNILFTDNATSQVQPCSNVAVNNVSNSNPFSNLNNYQLTQVPNTPITDRDSEFALSEISKQPLNTQVSQEVDAVEKSHSLNTPPHILTSSHTEVNEAANSESRLGMVYVCMYCQETFKDKAEHSRHMVTQHASEIIEKEEKRQSLDGQQL